VKSSKKLEAKGDRITSDLQMVAADKIIVIIKPALQVETILGVIFSEWGSGWCKYMYTSYH